MSAPSGSAASARLLLALTALYAQRSNHGAEQRQQFTVLALGLIDRAGAAACAAAAARLRGHPDAPAAVMERLGIAADVASMDIAGNRDSVDRSDAAGNADGVAGDAAAADPVGGDAGDEDGGHGDGGHGDEAEAGDGTLRNAPGPQRGGDHPCAHGPDPGSGEGTRGPLTREFGEAFFAAPPAGRRAMLEAMAAAGAAAPDPGRLQVRIDVNPWRDRTGAFARDFARLIDAPGSLAERILGDPFGEPLVVAARATGMPLAILQRILVLVSPAMHPVERVWALSELYHTVDAGGASELLAVWRAAAREHGGSARESASESASDAANETESESSGHVADESAGETADDPTGDPAGGTTAVANLRARLRALGARIDGRAVTPRSAPGNAGRHDPPSR